MGKYVDSDGKLLFPFGFGLSYTNFRYEHLVAAAPAAGKKRNIKLTVDVTNMGDREGDEVAQIYVHENESSVETPRGRWRDFADSSEPWRNEEGDLRSAAEPACSVERGEAVGGGTGNVYDIGGRIFRGLAECAVCAEALRRERWEHYAEDLDDDVRCRGVAGASRRTGDGCRDEGSGALGAYADDSLSWRRRLEDAMGTMALAFA